MKYNITKKDYINILNYYNESIPDNNKQLKERAWETKKTKWNSSRSKYKQRFRT